MANYISKIVIGGETYEIKDSVARGGGLNFILSTDASTTPLGVSWVNSSGTTITGTLAAADADSRAFYLVPGNKTEAKDIYSEYVVVLVGETKTWEKIGDTETDFSNLVTNVALNKGSGATVLGTGSTFKGNDSNVSFSGTTSQQFTSSVTSEGGKLATTTITGINGSQSITPVTGSTDVSIPNVSLGADVSASLVTTESKTASKVTMGTAVSVNKVSAGSAVSVATVDTAVTNVLTSTSDASELFTASVANETLTFSPITVTKKSIVPAKANGTITPVTVGSAVSVPQFTASDVAISSVKSTTSVTVPVVSLGTPISASKVTLGSAVALAKPASAATTVATGSISATGTGDAVVTQVDSSTATAITGLGTATAAGQTVTATVSSVKVANYDDLSLTVEKDA